MLRDRLEASQFESIILKPFVTCESNVAAEVIPSIDSDETMFGTAVEEIMYQGGT